MINQRFIGGLIWITWFCAITAQAGWIEKESRAEPSISPGPVHHHVVMQNSTTGDDATVEVATFSPKTCRLLSIDNPDGRSLAQAMDARKCLAGVNGGYFDEKFMPLGLRIDNGKTLSPLVRGRLLSGLIISSGSTIRILRVPEFGKGSRPQAAVQCGPFLVDHARPVPGLEGNRQARRSFVATTNTGQVALGFCSEVSLAELAAALASMTGDLKIQRALNLDGGSSSAFWFKRKDDTVFSISEQKSVRDFLAIGPQ